MWDIELPGQVLGTGSEVTKSNTMVINTLRPAWNTSQIHSSKPAFQVQQSDDQTGARSDVALSSLSLRPSQSASQIVTEEPRKPDKTAISKYFSQTENQQGTDKDSRSQQFADETQPFKDKLQETPQPPPVGDTELPEQDHRSEAVAEPKPVLVEEDPTLRPSRTSSRSSLCSLDRELQSVAGLYSHLSCHPSDSDSRLATFCRAYNDSAMSALEPPDKVYIDDLTPTYLPTGDLELNMILSSPSAVNEDELYCDPVFISDAFDPQAGILDDEVLDRANLDLDLMRVDATGDDLYYADESYCLDIDSLEDISQDAIPQTFWMPSDAANFGRDTYVVQEDSGLMMHDDSMAETYTEDCPDAMADFSDTLSIGTKFTPDVYEYETSSIGGIEADAEEHAVAPMEMQCFSQGRALLLGIANDTLDCEDDHLEAATLTQNYRSLTKMEEDVAKRLKGHWLPQRL